MNLDPNRPVGYESRKAYARRCESGFWDRWIKGPIVVDIGFRGGVADAVPIVPGAIGVERDGLYFDPYANVPVFLNPLAKNGNYDGFRLPFDDESVDAIHASHVLEHVSESETYLREWFRVLRVGGTMILMVPSAYLYERRFAVPPSRFSPEHLRCYTPASLLAEIERTLEPNTWRLRHMEDDDTGYDYSLPIDVHPVGSLEICCVIENISPPAWKVES